jgi:hypothetical protein
LAGPLSRFIAIGLQAAIKRIMIKARVRRVDLINLRNIVYSCY